MEIARGNKIRLEFTTEEALVFFEWIARHNETVKDEDFTDQAEQRVLWDIEASFETVIDEAFAKNYSELLSSAREKIRDKE